MKIKHDEHGMHYPFEGKYVTVMTAAVMQYLEDDDLITKCAQDLIKFNQALGRLSKTEVVGSDFRIGGPLTLTPVPDTTNWIKYISKGDYDNYYSKGRFQFGTSEYYRTIENEKSRDGFEGFNCSFLHVNDFHIPLIFFRCNNYLILCGSHQPKSEYLKKQFGEIEMRIKDISDFCEKVKVQINAKKYLIGKVQYSNARIYKSDPLRTESFLPNEIFKTQTILRFAIDNSLLPSLFVKPEFFKDEEELRIVFEMEKDFENPLKIENKLLLDHIEFDF